jgi:hypothetical protein
MRRVLVVVFAATGLSGVCYAQTAAQPDYRAQATGQELLGCLGQKIGTTAELMAANAKIADLEKQLSAMAAARSGPVATPKSDSK